MGFTIETGISAVTVFVQGLLSFFSPCVLLWYRYIWAIFPEDCILA